MAGDPAQETATSAAAGSGSGPGAMARFEDLALGRTLPAVFFSFFIVDKLLLTVESFQTLQRAGFQASPTGYLYPVNQALGLVYFSMLAFLYIIRLPRRGGDRRPLVVVGAMFGSFGVIIASFLPGVPPRLGLVLASDVLVLGGLVYTVWSLGYLRRSFSILPEARRLVTGGPYGLSRHPLYLGEAVAAIGLILPTIGLPGSVLVMLFLLTQYLRIGWEEAVLERQFPLEYADYRRRVPRYAPDPMRMLASWTRASGGAGS